MPRSKANKSRDAVTPVWFDLPRRFYERLVAAQEKFGVPQAKLLARGLELAIKEQESKREPLKSMQSADTIGLSDALRKVAEMRWQAASKEERKEVGRKLAEARWGKKRGKKTNKTEST